MPVASQRTGEHEQAGRLAFESEALVERQRSPVAGLGVHHCLGDVALSQPAQSVEHERGTEPATVVVGVNGEPLHVAASPGPSRHGVASDLLSGGADAEAGDGCRADRLSQAVPVEAPEGGERGTVDGKREGAIPGPRSADDSWWRVGQRAQVVHEQVQLLMGLEACVLETRTLALGQRAGEHALVAAIAEDRARVAHHRHGRRDRVADRCHERDAVITPPGPDAQPLVAPSHDFGAHEGRLGGRSPYARPSVRVLLSTSERYSDHDAGRGHPERPARLDAVLRGVEATGLGDAIVRIEPRAATRDELVLLHPAGFLDSLEQFCLAGGGRLDPDTSAGVASWDVAVLAAGAGIDAAERLDRGEGDAAFLALRPPGHHATPTRAMGFCLLNNVAVTAATLAARGERVAILDWDAHHGNGTQDAFYGDDRVLYISFHEFPLYPFTGRLDETGSGRGVGTTINVPLPAHATGDVLLRAMDDLVTPAIESFGPTWLLISAGFDGHRADPLTGLGLSSGDFADLTRRALAFAPAGRRLVFLEGGYDLQALADSTAACVGALADLDVRAESSTSGGPGRDVVEAAVLLRTVDRAR